MTYPNILDQPLDTRHTIFVSCHHEFDQAFFNYFAQYFSDEHSVLSSRFSEIGDFAPHLNIETIRQRIRNSCLYDSTVTVVLIGEDTWKRKHVDWEINASIASTLYNPCSGLIGILLPTYPWLWKEPDNYTSKTIPPRLNANIECGFAKIYRWTEDPLAIHQWIHEAFERRRKVLPDNSYPSFTHNLSGYEWI